MLHYKYARVHQSAQLGIKKQTKSIFLVVNWIEGNVWPASLDTQMQFIVDL